MILYLLLLYQLPGLSCSTSFNASGQGLTSIPISIPNDVKTIHLDSNSIQTTKSEDFLKFYRLHTFFLRNGELSEFPNFTFVSQTLQVLRLDSNSISHIPSNLLDILVTLKTLDLSRNKLTSIPDVSGPGNSLELMQLDHNLFTEFPSLKLLGKSLSHLRFIENHITTFKAALFPIQKHHINETVLINFNRNMNLAAISPIISEYKNHIHIKFLATAVECGAQLLWLLSPNIIMEGICKDSHTGETVELQEQLLLNYSGSLSPSRSTSMKMLMSDTYNVITPMTSQSVEEVTQCIMYCLQTPGCLYVNYKPPPLGVSLHNCYVSDPLGGVMMDQLDGGPQEWTYYGVD